MRSWLPTFPPPRPLVVLLLLVGVPAGTEALASQVEIRRESGAGDSSIQEAINAAASGDTIFIGAGTWTEPLRIEGKSLTLLGEGRDVTVLDVAFTGRVVTIELSEHVVLQGMTLRRGLANAMEYPDNAGGGVAAFTSSLSLIDCNIEFMRCQGLGAGVYATVQIVPGLTPPPGFSPRSPGLEIRGCRFENARAGDTGGAVFAEETPCVILDAVFRDCAAVDGGALGLLGSSLDLTDVEFEANEASLSGGAISASGVSHLNLVRARFANNVAGNFGGGLFCVNGVSVLLDDCRFVANVALSGGALQIVNGVLTARWTAWVDHTNTGNSGLIGVTVVLAGASGTFERCTWLGNSGVGTRSLLLIDASAQVERCVLGDEGTLTFACQRLSTMTSLCNIGNPGVTDCVEVESSETPKRCPSDPTSFCAIPGTTCGAAGHLDAPCDDPACSTPVERATWGRLKTRY